MTNRFRIVHLIETLGYGGAERLLATNLAHLDREAFEHIVVHLFEPDSLRTEIEALGVTCIGLRLPNRRNWMAGLRSLRRQLKASKPDLLHTHLVRADIYGRLAGRSLGIPVMCTIHESPYYPEVYFDNPGLNRRKYALMRRIDAWTARWFVDEFVIVSQFSGHAAHEYLGISEDRMRLIYNSLDVERVQPASAAVESQLRQQLAIRPGERVIVHVGRMAPQKGHRYLLEAFRSVLSVHPGVRLVLRGDGPLRESMIVLADDLGIASQVTFAPPVTHASWLIGLGDVFAFPSLHEGFGIAMLEAMAMSKPCVASALPPIMEIVDDGRSGLLVPPRDSRALARALIALLDDPERARAMGQHARQAVLDRFDVRKNALALQALYAARFRPSGHADAVVPLTQSSQGS